MPRKHKKNSNDDNSQSYNNKLNRTLKPLTSGQSEYIRTIVESDITFCTGPAGSGKTHIAAGLACEHLLHGKASNILITRPIIETGFHGLGHLPGTVNEKIHPYLLPLMDEMIMFLGKYKLELYIQNGSIRIVPLEVMRGYNFNNCFMILDEAQNALLSQIKMFVTRIGFNSKAVVTGDMNQSDLLEEKMGLKRCIEKLSNVKGVGIYELTTQDIVRNNIIHRILEKL